MNNMRTTNEQTILQNLNVSTNSYKTNELVCRVNCYCHRTDAEQEAHATQFQLSLRTEINAVFANYFHNYYQTFKEVPGTVRHHT